MSKIKWHTKALYIFVALALVLSLGVAGVVPGATKTAAADCPDGPVGPDIPELLVYIERPSSSLNPMPGDTFYVNAVVSYKDIEENGLAALDVSATIDTGPT